MGPDAAQVVRLERALHESLLISQNRRTLTALPDGVKPFAGPVGRNRAIAFSPRASFPLTLGRPGRRISSRRRTAGMACPRTEGIPASRIVFHLFTGY